MKEFIVYSGSRRSKPVTAERIKQRYADGDICIDTPVQQVGTTFRVPIASFLGASPTSATIVPRGRRRAAPRIAWVAMLLLFVVIHAMWRMKDESNPQAGVMQQAGVAVQAVVPDADLAIVREDLRQKPDSGEWEEVRTCPARSITADKWPSIWGKALLSFRSFDEYTNFRYEYRNLRKGYINQHIALLRLLASVNSRAMAYSLTHPEGLQKIVQHIQYGMTKASLSLIQVRSLPVPLPPAEEQVEIITQIERMLGGTDDIEEEVADSESALTQLDQSILAKAFRGELFPQDPRDEPAAELLNRIRTTREATATQKQPRKKTTRPRRNGKADT